MKKYCVIGVGRFGFAVATKLAEYGKDVLAVDSNESIINSIKDLVTQAVCMRVADEDALRSIGIEEVDTVIVAIGENFAQSILITALLKQRIKIPRVIVRSVSNIHRDILVLIGADHVILPEQEMGTRLADQLSLHGNSVPVTQQFAVSFVTAKDHFVGATIDELDLEKNYDVILLGKKIGEDIVPLTNTYKIELGDVFAFAGKNQSIEALEAA